MKRIIGFCACLLALFLTAACVRGGETIPDEDTPAAGPAAPELPTIGMEPAEVAEAFVQAWLRSAYLYEEDGFTPYTATAMAAFDPAGSVTMDGQPATYDALKRNAQYLREKCRYWQYVRQEQGIVRNDFLSPCVVQITDEEDTWANAVVSGMMSWTYADGEGDSGMEFTFNVMLFRTDHRTDYAWLVGDAAEPFDWFDAAYKNDPEFNADTLIAEYDGPGVTYSSGDSSPKAWKLTEVLREDVTDRKHNRNVRIMQLSADSAHTDGINALLSDEFTAILGKYMKAAEVPYDDWKLEIDTEAWETDGILAAAVIADEPAADLARITVRNVFLDLTSDTLLSLDEYAERAGILTAEEAAAELSAGWNDESRPSPVCSCAGLFRENGKTVYVMRITYVKDGAETGESCLYVPGEARIQGEFKGFAEEP